MDPHNDLGCPSVSGRLSIEFIHMDPHNDPRPWTQVEIGGVPMWAMLDTGGAKLRVSRALPFLATNLIDSFGEPYRRLTPLGDYRTHQPVVLRDIGFGIVVETRVPAIVEDQLHPYTAIVGMNVLLRYSQVCFSWRNMRLHLGNLGPCSEGVEPYQGAALRLGSIPTVRIRPARGLPYQVAIDTGSGQTLCQERFIDRMGGARFRFGHSHPDLEAHCAANTIHDLVTNQAGARAWEVPAVIGMDTLIKFDAFGWELNPFRMYFVPKGHLES